MHCAQYFRRVDDESGQRYIKAIGKGLLKGHVQDGHLDLPILLRRADFRRGRPVSRVRSTVFHRHCTSIEGIGLDEIARKPSTAPDAYSATSDLAHALDVGGDYALPLRGEKHAWTPDEVTNLQHAVRGNSQDELSRYAAGRSMSSSERSVDHARPVRKPAENRTQADRSGSRLNRRQEIVKRFATGAMSMARFSRGALQPWRLR